MKKLIYLIVAIAVLGLIVPGCIPVVPPADQNGTSVLTKVYPPGPGLTFYNAPNGTTPITTFDRGTVVGGYTYNIDFYLKNTGEVPLTGMTVTSNLPASQGTISLVGLPFSLGVGVANNKTVKVTINLTATPGSSPWTLTVNALDQAYSKDLGVTMNIPVPANRPPTVAADNSAVTVNEGAMATNTGTWSDLDGDGVALTASVGAVVKNDGTWSWSLLTTDGPADTQSVAISATDDHGAVGNVTFQLTVNNVVPTLDPPTVNPLSSGNLYPVCTDLTLEGQFTDPSPVDAYTLTINWDDTTTTTVNLVAGASPHLYSVPKTYTSAGVYAVMVTVTDDDEGISNTQTVQIVVYDPNGGFVTGGGWIQSPEGAYQADETLTGKATFGFVSKYQKGQPTPAGNTEFQFKAGNLNFHSESYDWLVIAGPKAMYKGTGTINGTGEYGFMLSATDSDPDLFRIKIQDKSTNNVIYDNKQDGEDGTELGGGQIVIHK